jgi:hypothetical protein
MPRKKKKPPTQMKKIYDKPRATMCIGEKAITAAMARKILGWEEEEGKDKFGSNHVPEVTGAYGRKVRLLRNTINRPIYRGVLNTLKQEILCRWQFNGEPIIIGEYGSLLDGQHSLIALILAVKEWREHQDKWKDHWHEEPRIDKLIVTGVSEDDKVVNTINTCKSRSFMDVVYRDSRFFSDLKHRDRRAVSRITDHAVRMLWSRTGACLDPFAPRRTHSESVDFIERHPRLLEAIKHVYQEDGSQKVLSAYLTPGYLSALLYLMGTSASDVDAYRAGDPPSEKQLDLSKWNDACDFIVLLAAGGKQLTPLRQAIRNLMDSEEGASVAERCALIINTWQHHANGQEVMIQPPSVGGIDRGDSDGANGQGGATPTPTEIQERAAEVKATTRREPGERKRPVKKTPPTTTQAKKRPATSKSAKRPNILGGLMWVTNPIGDNWRGKLLRVEGENAILQVCQGFQGAGNEVRAPVDRLSRKQPT